MARTTSDYPGSLDVFVNAATDFNPGDAVPSTDFERLIDAIKTIQTKLGITGGTALLDSAVTINESGADKDFRVEGVGEPDALFVQGSDGKVAIGTASPSAALFTITAAANSNITAFLSTHATLNEIFIGNTIAANDCFVIGFNATSDYGYMAVHGDSNIFVIADTGKIGIGTSVIPHGGIGSAKLAIEGADSSAATGPMVQFTTATDDYPLLQIHPFTHDNIQLNFDSYDDKSSDAGSNYRIIKYEDLWKVQYDSGIAQGAAITWNNGIALATDGGIFFGGLLQQSSAQLIAEYDATTKELYAETSTKRHKEDIKDLDVDTSKLLNLIPKTYTDKKTGRREFGLIAEEVAEIMPEVVVFDENDKPLGIKLTRLPIVLLNEIKKLNARLLALEA